MQYSKKKFPQRKNIGLSNLEVMYCKMLLMVVAEAIRLKDAEAAVPIQMDMSMNGKITVCTGISKLLACRDGSNLAIRNAFWGRTSDIVCPSDAGDPVTDCEGSKETLPLVKKYCESKNEYRLQAKHSLLQNNGTHHCPGVNKYLIVQYTCIPESKGVTLCESAETTLTCEAGWFMELADVFWGRRSSSKFCGTDEGVLDCDSSVGVSRHLKTQCNLHRTCVVKATETDLKDTSLVCRGQRKYLMVNYICKPVSENPDESTKELMDD